MERFTIRFDDDLFLRLKLFARGEGKSVSAVVREALCNYVEEHQEGAAGLERRNETTDLTDANGSARIES